MHNEDMPPLPLLLIMLFLTFLALKGDSDSLEDYKFSTPTMSVLGFNKEMPPF